MAAESPSNVFTPAVQKMIQEEVSRQVAAQVQVETAKFREQTLAAQHEFLRLPADEQRLATWLLQLREPPAQHDITNEAETTEPAEANPVSLIPLLTFSTDPRTILCTIHHFPSLLTAWV